MAPGRRGRRRGRAAGLAAAALGSVLGGGAARGALGAGGGFPTPEEYEELAPAEACRVGCESLRMSGKELLAWWKKQPEADKSWFGIANPLQKMLTDLGDLHVDPEMPNADMATFKIGDLILTYLADLEDEVEAEHERETGLPAAEASREDKQARLLAAYMDKEALEWEGDVLPGLGWDEDPEYLRAAHVNQYHKMTGFLQWPHYDWRGVPSTPLQLTCKWDFTTVMFISLARRTDRRAELKAKMPKEVPYSVVDAVEGKNLDLNEIGTYQGYRLEEDDPMTSLVPSLLMHFIDMPHPYLQQYWSRDVSAGEIGLVLSLKRVFDRAQSEGLGSVLVLEDDHTVVPRPYCLFLGEVAKLQESGIEWDFIVIESYNWFGDDANNLPEGLGPFFTRVSGAHNTHAIMYSARGMQRVKDSGFFDRCIMPLDEYLSYMANPGRHTRSDFHDCLGPGGGAAPERFVGLRWRGTRLVQASESAALSSIDTAEDGGDGEL